MKLIKEGKTKDVYLLEDNNILLRFKDTVTGGEDGQSDPGGNLVVGKVDGVGSNALAVTTYYFEKLKGIKFPTHYISSDLEKNEMVVCPVTTFGKGLEFVVRFKAFGSFTRRYGDYCKDGDKLDSVYEVTLKNDERNDPPATKETIIALKLMDKKTYDKVEKLTKKVCKFIYDDLAEKGLELVDIKVEFGLFNNKPLLIDEISAGNMRVYKDGKKLSYLELSNLILSKQEKACCCGCKNH